MAASATFSTSVETATASASVVHPGLDVAALKRRQEVCGEEELTVKVLDIMRDTLDNKLISNYYELPTYIRV
jgi:hypothetical protein